MARFAVVDALNNIVGFSPQQVTYNPLKGSAVNPAPWRSLSAPIVAKPSYDPATETVDGPTYTVNANDVTELWTKRLLTAGETSTIKDNEISAADTIALTVMFNHENRIRALEAKAPITKAQFITAVKGLL